MPKGIKQPIEVNGKWYPSIRAAAAGEGMNYHTVKNRLSEGYTTEEAFCTPQVQRIKPVQIGRKRFPSIKAAADYYNVPVTTVRTRLSRNCPIEEAVLPAGDGISRKR